MRGYFAGLVDKGDVLKVSRGAFLVNDLELIRSIMSDAQRFKNFDFSAFIQELAGNKRLNISFPELAEASRMWLILMNGERHLDARKQMHQALYQQDLSSVVQEETRRVLDGLAGRDAFDLMQDFCDPLISRIICTLAGVDPEIFPVMKDLSAKSMEAFEPYHTMEGIRLAARVEREVRDVMQQQVGKGAESQSGMIAAMQRHYGDAGMGTAISILEFFFTAGIETSAMLICTSLFRLMSDLGDHIPSLYSEEVDGVVEELIRMGSGASLLARKVQERALLSGRWFNPGDSLYLNIAGANRDGRYFPFPDTIHPENRKRKHLAFGTGRHHCVGANLSRLELKIILPAFFERFKAGTVKPVPGGQVMRSLYFTPGFSKLPVTVDR